MKEETNAELKPHWFRGYRDYWTGIGVMLVLYSIIYGATGTHGMGLVLGILMSLVFSPIAFGLISGIIFLIAWIFKRNFTLKRFLTILTVVLVISLLSKLIVMIRYGG
ncbi:MAG: hypothetical protein RIA69_01415 [Cyclobacteriaceae bacterium]